MRLAIMVYISYFAEERALRNRLKWYLQEDIGTQNIGVF